MKWFKINIELTVSSVFVLVIIIVRALYSFDSKIFLGLLGIIATLYFGSLRYRIENDRLFKELFTEFNLHYNDRINDLLNKLRVDTKYVLKQFEVNIIIDYFNLSSEEYLWRTKNRIPKNVWEAWKAGIKENLEIKQVFEVYQNEISTVNGRKSFYGLVEELENIN